MSQPLPALRRDLRFTPHRQFEKVWYAVEDPLTGRYLRIGRQEYLAAIQFDGVRDAASVIDAATKLDPAFELNETDIPQLVSWLARVGFLVNPQASTSMRSEARPISTRSVWDPLGARFPLIPGNYVERVARALQPLVSTTAALIMLVLVAIAGAMIAAQWSEFASYTGKLFVPEGRLWWIVAWLLLKVVHELGHAVTAVRAGTQVRSAGISIFFFAPVPYIDVSDLWSISNRWHRILCSAGGILFEVGIATIAVFAAFMTENESLRFLACAVATTGTITTVAFNANPFIRFDGYYILADLTQRSNLWSDGQSAVRQAFHRLIKPFSTAHEPISLTMLAYGSICLFYRVAMLLGIALWSLIVWQEYGLLIIAWAVYAWYLSPWLKSRKVAKQSAGLPSADGSSRFAPWWQTAVVSSLGALVLLLPAPIQPTVPGVVELRDPLTIRTQSEGTLTHLHVTQSQAVEAGQLLAEFQNVDLRIALETKRIEVALATESIAVFRARGELAKAQAEQAKLVSLNEQLAQLEKDDRELKIYAPSSGVVVANDLSRQIGRHFKPGEPLLLIANPAQWNVKLSASQQDQVALRQHLGEAIRFTSNGSTRSCARIESVESRGSDLLTEPALAATYGGPITVAVTANSKDQNGIKLPAPRFEVRLAVEEDRHHSLVPGQLAWARIPNHSTNLLGLCHRWLTKQWEATKRENEAAF